MGTIFSATANYHENIPTIYTLYTQRNKFGHTNIFLRMYCVSLIREVHSPEDFV